MKTYTKITIYTDKCICSGNIWCVSVIHVNTLENIICRSGFGKDSLAKFIWQSLLCVNAHTLLNILCQIFIAKRNFLRGNVALFDITYFLDKWYDSIYNFCP